MKKLFLVFLMLVNSIVAANEMKYFKGHFDIEKPKPDIHTKNIDIFFQAL